jgi:hypothetical protein
MAVEGDLIDAIKVLKVIEDIYCNFFAPNLQPYNN